MAKLKDKSLNKANQQKGPSNMAATDDGYLHMPDVQDQSINHGYLHMTSLEDESIDNGYLHMDTTKDGSVHDADLKKEDTDSMPNRYLNVGGPQGGYLHMARPHERSNNMTNLKDGYANIADEQGGYVNAAINR